MDDFRERLKEIIDSSSRIVFFGGAGVSTESGIPMGCRWDMFAFSTKRHIPLGCVGNQTVRCLAKKHPVGMLLSVENRRPPFSHPVGMRHERTFVWNAILFCVIIRRIFNE